VKILDGGKDDEGTVLDNGSTRVGGPRYGPRASPAARSSCVASKIVR
jgi:hypothetical protein